MIRWLLAVVLVFGLGDRGLSLYPIEATESRAKTLPALQSLRAKVKGAKVLRAQFRQEIHDSFFPGDEETATGRLLFRRPHQVEWIYETPEARTIRYQGRQLEIEEKGHHEKIETQGPVSLEAAFSFLWGESREDLFVVEARVKADRPAKQDQAFVLRPRQKKDSPFQEIEFWVEKGFVKEALIQTASGSLSRLTFSDWKIE